MKPMTPLTIQILHIVYFSFALLFIGLLNQKPYALSPIIKATPALILAMATLGCMTTNKGRLMAAGFCLSAIGDILLDLDPAHLFIFGLVAFLLAHLFYTATFINKPRTTKIKSILCLGLLLYGTVLGICLYDHLGDMQLPVFVYLFIIIGMGIASCIGGANHWLAVLGASLFIISDSFIAVDRFLVPILCQQFWIMLFYYAGQWCIAWGMIKTFQKNI